MDADLLTIARRLAEGGHLGNDITVSKALNRVCFRSMHTCVTEADIYLAAHNAIVAKGWKYTVGDNGWTSVMVQTNNDEVPWEDYKTHSENGTTTLALLTAFAAALEAK